MSGPSALHCSSRLHSGPASLTCPTRPEGVVGRSSLSPRVTPPSVCSDALWQSLRLAVCSCLAAYTKRPEMQVLEPSSAGQCDISRVTILAKSMEGRPPSPSAKAAPRRFRVSGQVELVLTLGRAIPAGGPVPPLPSRPASPLLSAHRTRCHHPAARALWWQWACCVSSAAGFDFSL